MDLSSFANPYDFANPVSEEQLFVGREHELDEIRYYLDHTKKAGRPINLALLGPRASGKTSLLNMTEKEAQKRGLMTVRLDLDEGVVENELRFFFKIFDAVFSSACDKGAYGGLEGRTCNHYLEMVCAFTVPEDRLFCPLNFPIRYAIAMKQNNESMIVPDAIFVKDLEKIYAEVKIPFVLLFDECNVLSAKRVLLEKTRNIFMNLKGFMLVFSGTPDLFPAMDQVFSPIVRQFKKINIGAFKTVNDTEKCIVKPLESIGIAPEKIIHRETFWKMEEIHDLAGGKPYETQLICHIMFRRVHDKKTKTMRLDLGTIEELLAELESSQHLASRPLIRELKQLRISDLRALSRLCVCNGRASLDQVWNLDYIVKGNKGLHKGKLVDRLEFLEKRGLVTRDTDGVIDFCGDEFERIYAKYFLRQNRVPLIFPESLEAYWHYLITQSMLAEKPVELAEEMVLTESDIDVTEVVKAIRDEDDIFERGFPFMDALYRLMVTYRDRGTIPIIEMGLTLGWLNCWMFFFSPDPTKYVGLEKWLNSLHGMATRAADLEYNMVVRFKEVEVLPFETLISKIESLSNTRKRHFFSLLHHQMMVSFYLERNDLTEALFHAAAALRCCNEMNPQNSNNIGYVFLKGNHFETARKLFEQALAISVTDHDRVLPLYNCGVLEALTGNYAAADRYFDECITKLESQNQPPHECDRLTRPYFVGSEIAFREESSCDLLNVAKQAKAVTDSLISQDTTL